MNPAITVNHQTGNYPIFIGAGLLERIDELLKDFVFPGSRDTVVTDQNVHELYYRPIARSLHRAMPDKDPPWCHVCPAGEESKSLAQMQLILTELLENKIDRRSTIIALGGGVVGDLAGFVAASFLRGVNLVQIPTTLLAQVDSSVGGKTGINLPQAKNCVGAFWQPAAVFIDPSVLTTLETREYTSGLAEVAKYGLIMDESFLEFLEQNVQAINELDMETLEKVILRCCQLKAEVVEADERETSGRRAILNYGHTFGHAIESVFGYGTWPHGHAVALGMHAAAHLAEILGRIDRGFVTRQQDLLCKLNLPVNFPGENHEQMFQAMQLDKKTTAGNIRFILPSAPGHVDLVDSIDRTAVLEAMRRAGRNDKTV